MLFNEEVTMKKAAVVLLLAIVGILSGCNMVGKNGETETAGASVTDGQLPYSGQREMETIRISLDDFGGQEIHIREKEKRTISERYDIPDRIRLEKYIPSAKLTVCIDAMVVVPDEKKIPIAKIKRCTFSQELVSTLFHGLCDSEMVKKTSSENLSKIQIAQIIVDTEEEMNRYEKDPVMQYYYQEELQDLVKQFENAPLFVNEDVCDGSMYLIERRSEAGKKYYLGVDAVSRDHSEYFIVTNPIFDENGLQDNSNIRWNDSHLYFHNWRNKNISGDYGTRIVIEDPFEPRELKNLNLEIEFLPAYAKSYAEWFFEHMGIDNLSVNSIILLLDKDNSNKYSYQLLCSQGVGKVAGTYFDIGVGSESEGEESYYWLYESIKMCVDEEGIYYFSWDAPISIQDIIMLDAPLIPFEDVLNRLIETLAKKEGIEEDVVCIKKITLSLQRIVITGSEEEGLLIPVWNFYGSDEQMSKSISLLSINAMDGSIIDPIRGY